MPSDGDGGVDDVVDVGDGVPRADARVDDHVDAAGDPTAMSPDAGQGAVQDPGAASSGDASLDASVTLDSDAGSTPGDDAGEDTAVCYADVDKDDFGAGAPIACDGQQGSFAENDKDCDDLALEVFPGAPEQCNFRDDDCDELVDDGVSLNKIGVGAEQIFTCPITSPTAAQVALLPRSGGAWLLYRPYATSSDVGRSIRAVRLDSTGAYEAATSDPKAISSGASYWAADGNGSRVVLLEKERGSDASAGKASLRVRYLDASSLSELGRQTVAQVDDGYLMPIDVSMLEADDGTIYALSVFVQEEPSGASSVVRTKFMVTFRDSSGNVAARAVQTLGTFGLNAAQLAIERVPCRSEWMVAYALSSNGTTKRDIRRIGTAGTIVGSTLDTIDGSTGVRGMRANEIDCASEDPSMVVAYAVESGIASLRRWKVDRATGGLTRIGSQDVALPGNAYGVSLAELGGRWFGVYSDPLAARLYQIDFANAANPLRPISLYSDVSGADPGEFSEGFWSSGLTPGSTAVINAGAMLVVALPRMIDGGNLDSLRATLAPVKPGDPASVVTYRVGCN